MPRLQSTDGQLDVSGRPLVVLTFASALDDRSRENLARLVAIAPQLQHHGIVVMGLSVDELPVLRAVTSTLGLNFPLVSEGPGYGFHPLSDELGVFHGPPIFAIAPVDATGLFVIGAGGRLLRSAVSEPGALLPASALDGLP
ncbi:MAG: redoxin domain-containing protein [Candidatus Dormibacteria bacterium]